MGNIAFRSPSPVLVPLDKGYAKIPFQFLADDLVENGGSNYAESSSLGMPNPVLQFTKGNLKTITFTARLFAQNGFDSIKPLLDALRQAQEPDPKLKRPPIWIFVWGNAIDAQVVVESIGNIRYDPLRSDGSARGVTLSISLKRYEFFSLSLTDPNARPTNTTYVVVRDGDTWESLAQRVYGNPNYGDFLRRMFPATLTPAIGTTVALPDEDKFDNLLMAPESVPLARTSDGIAARRAIFELRNVPKVSTVLTKV